MALGQLWKTLNTILGASWSNLDDLTEFSCTVGFWILVCRLYYSGVQILDSQLVQISNATWFRFQMGQNWVATGLNTGFWLDFWHSLNIRLRLGLCSKLAPRESQMLGSPRWTQQTARQVAGLDLQLVQPLSAYWSKIFGDCIRLMLFGQQDSVKFRSTDIRSSWWTWITQDYSYWSCDNVLR